MSIHEWSMKLVSTTVPRQRSSGGAWIAYLDCTRETYLYVEGQAPERLSESVCREMAHTRTLRPTGPNSLRVRAHSH